MATRSGTSNTQARKALALLRRLSRAGSGLWDGIARGDTLGLADKRMNDLLAPVNVNKTLAAFLARDPASEQSKMHRRSRAPNLTRSKDSRGGAKTTQAGGAAVSKRSLRDVARDTQVGKSVTNSAAPVAKATSKPTPVPAHSPAKKATPSAANAMSRPARSLKDVAKLRSAQRRQAIHADAKPLDPDKTSGDGSSVDQSRFKEDATREFASLHEFSNAKAAHFQSEQFDKMTKKPDDLPNFKSQMIVPGTDGDVPVFKHKSRARPLGFSEPQATQNAAPLEFAPNDPRQPESSGPIFSAVSREALASGAGFSRAASFASPANRNTSSSDLKLSKDLNDLGEAAWRNGVEPE